MEMWEEEGRGEGGKEEGERRKGRRGEEKGRREEGGGWRGVRVRDRVRVKGRSK